MDRGKLRLFTLLSRLSRYEIQDTRSDRSHVELTRNIELQALDSDESAGNSQCAGSLVAVVAVIVIVARLPDPTLATAVNDAIRSK